MTDAPVLPPYLYLPCARAVSDPADAIVDLRYLSDGRIALLGYTALDRLLSCCGRWDVLLLDIEIPENERRSAHDNWATPAQQESL